MQTIIAAIIIVLILMAIFYLSDLVTRNMHSPLLRAGVSFTTSVAMMYAAIYWATGQK